MTGRQALAPLQAVVLLLAATLIAPAWASQRTAAPSARQLQCMALNIYWEGDRSNMLDLRAIAHVTENRVRDPAFPDNVCDVVKQGGERPLYGCQFDWWCDGRSDRPTDQASWRRALAVATMVLSGTDSDPTGGALYFHDTRVTPSWAATLQPTVTIGDHIFYR